MLETKRDIYISFNFLPLYRQLDDLDSLTHQVQVQVDAPVNSHSLTSGDSRKKATPLSLRWRCSLRLKLANEHPEIISSSKIFHTFTTLLAVPVTEREFSYIQSDSFI